MIVIRVEYDDLGVAAGELNTLAEDIANAYSQMNQQFQQLHDGEWIGNGANVFFEEFESVVAPAVDRLSSALQNAAQKVIETSSKFEDAEHEAKIKIEISFN